MVAKLSPFDLLSDRIEDIYLLLKKKAFEKVNTEEVVDYLIKMTKTEVIPALYYKFIENLMMYEALLEYLNIKYSRSEDYKFLFPEIYEAKTEKGTLYVKVSRPIVFLMQMAIVGAYTISRIINPYATAQLKAILASIFYDMFIYKLKKIRNLLEQEKIEEAKNMIDHILEIDAKNVFNQIIPLPSLIEFTMIQYNKKKRTLKEVSKWSEKELKGEYPYTLLYVYPYIAKLERDQEILSYVAKRLLQATETLKSTISEMKKENEKD